MNEVITCCLVVFVDCPYSFRSDAANSNYKCMISRLTTFTQSGLMIFATGSNTIIFAQKQRTRVKINESVVTKGINHNQCISIDLRMKT